MATALAISGDNVEPRQCHIRIWGAGIDTWDYRGGWEVILGYYRLYSDNGNEKMETTV